MFNLGGSPADSPALSSVTESPSTSLRKSGWASSALTQSLLERREQTWQPTPSHSTDTIRSASQLERDVWRAALAVCGLGLCLSAAPLALAYSGGWPPPEPGSRALLSPLGWIGLSCAVLMYGSASVVVRLPSVAEARVHPLVLLAYQACGVALVCLLPLPLELHRCGWRPRAYAAKKSFAATALAFHCHNGTIELTNYGFAAAAAVILAHFFAYHGARRLGAAAMAAVVAAVAAASAFAWGVLYFGEPLRGGGPTAALALPLVVFGAVCAGCAPRAAARRGGHQRAGSGGSAGATSGCIDAVGVSPAASPAARIAAPTAAYHDAPAGSPAVGLLCAVVVGLGDGSLMAPYLQYSRAAAAGDAKDVHPLERDFAYLGSVGLGFLALVGLCALLALLRCLCGARPPSLQLRAVGATGLTAGIFWGTAHLGCVQATKYLGMSLGVPLAQAAVVISGLWGVAVFEEGRGPAALSVFAAGAAALAVGAALLVLAAA